VSTIRTAADAIRRGDVQLTDITRGEGMPDADMALIDLLNALAWWREAITSGDDMGVAVAVNRVHAAGESLADAITRREQQ